jgi:sensor domain CHASE-containing protein
MGTLLVWQYTMEGRRFEWLDLVLPLAVVFFVLVVLQVLIALVLPLRWPAIRAQFHEHLQSRLRAELEQYFNQIPTDINQEVLAERRQIEAFVKEIHEVTSWLVEREEAASVMKLYGSAPPAP